MNNIYRFFSVVFFLTLLSANSCFGGLVVTMGNGQGLSNPILVTPGQSAAFRVFAQSTVLNDGFNSSYNGGINLSAFGMAIDFGGDGFGINSSFTNFGVASLGAGEPFFQYSFLTLDTTTAGELPTPNFDLIVNGTGSSTQLIRGTNQTPTELFDLTFNVAANAAPGVYAVNFILTTLPSAPFPNFTEFSATESGFEVFVLQGSFQVVPEPNLASFITVIITGIAGQRRRNRNRVRP